ncbi:hypothetical protein EC973_002594 [Apophysomyces ossiformis]|uniref:DNA (cytosine-5)-methyltransferase n=1 Tax=Apophysomyces ossiformis TaxID=679940 RepID=A0A8H7BNK7_9FUNG|nr:hypothetical protein EC973_002594 [Apophysomyces ossiformis]
MAGRRINFNRSFPLRATINRELKNSNALFDTHGLDDMISNDDEQYDEDNLKQMYPSLYRAFGLLGSSVIWDSLQEHDFDADLAADSLSVRIEKTKTRKGVRKTTSRKPLSASDDSRNTLASTEPIKARNGKTKRKSLSSTEPRKKPRKNKTESLFYTIGSEIEESENLEVVGENNEEDAEDRTLPMRNLDNFVLYDINNNNRIQSLDDIGKDNMEIRASGDVSAIFVEDVEEEEVDDDDDDEDKTDEPITTRVQLTCIFFWEVYMNANGKSEIWIQTQYGWYKLIRPADRYRPFYDPVAARTRIANIAESVLEENPKATYECFLQELNNTSHSLPTESNTCYQVTVCEADLQQHAAFVIEEIELWAHEMSKTKALQSPLLKELVRIRDETVSVKTKAKGRPADTSADDNGSRRTVRQKNQDVLHKFNSTCVTPHISAIAKEMFVRPLIEIKEAAEEAEIVTSKAKLVTSAMDIEDDENRNDGVYYKESTDHVHWHGEILATKGARKYYGAAIIDSELIQVGDCVYLRNGTESPWFARVIYMYEESDKLMFHARYFSHGKDTLLQEFAGNRELFLLDECSDNNLDCVMGKCQLTHLDANEKEPVEFGQKNFWFYRYWYDTNYAVFEDAKIHENKHGLDIFGDYRDCMSCQVHAKEKDKNKVIWNSGQSRTEDGFRYQGHEYHLHDFVYITTGEPNEPYLIGQILALETTKIEEEEPSSPSRSTRKKRSTKRRSSPVASSLPAEAKIRVYIRADLVELFDHNKVVEKDNLKFKSSRELYQTDDVRTVNVSLFEGTCWVDHIDAIDDLTVYKKQYDSFYVSKKYSDETLGLEDFVRCDICMTNRQKTQNNHNQYLQNMPKLIGLDIFSGCGGLTCGMEMTGVVDTRYSIEFYPSAALSFEKNFTGSIAYNQCANILLERAIAQHSRNEQLEEMNDHMGRPLKPMPKPGDVDFIYCGPPCQGYSGINRYKKADDIKNTLVCTALSYVDFYKPKYFLLENVRGLVNFKLGGEQEGTNRIKGGIQMGVVKYILRCLTSMGYQARFSIQQAGHYGVAQSRRRLFIWGSKIGYSLPDFPQPITCFPKPASLSINLPDGKTFSYMKRTDGQAPLPTVTVGDSISELPGFEYINTHKEYPETKEDINMRNASKVPQLPACHQGIVGDIKQVYTNPPLTDFQDWIRSGAGDELCNHFTRAWNSINVERIYNVEMKPGADHSSLPEKLKPWCLSHQDSAASRHNGWKGLYGRLDYNGQFQTTLTEMSPMGKQGTVIHPNQRRVLTVRECARSQGFPDWFVFYSTSPDGTFASVKDMYRQVGNAVPVPLAFALGNKLKEALVKDWVDA